MNLHKASIFNFEPIDILRDSIGYLSKKLLLFNLHGIFVLNFEYKVIVVWICSDLPFLILSVSIYYRTRSNIWVKRYCRLNFHGVCIYNFERHDILRDSIEHPSKKLLPLVIAVCICTEFPFLISSVSIYYRTRSDLRVRRYCHLNLLKASVTNFERIEILWVSIGHRSKKLLPFEFALVFHFKRLDILWDSIRHRSKNLLPFEFVRSFRY